MNPWSIPGWWVNKNRQHQAIYLHSIQYVQNGPFCCHALPPCPFFPCLFISCLWLGCVKVSVDDNLARWATSGHEKNTATTIHEGSIPSVAFCPHKFLWNHWERINKKDETYRKMTFQTLSCCRCQLEPTGLMLHIVKTTKCHSDARQWTPPQEVKVSWLLKVPE